MPRNFMPLVHQARRTIHNRLEGNPFATDEVIAAEIESLTSAYMQAQNARIAARLKVEIDRLEMLTEPTKWL
jgi:hypothetical protein